MTSNLPAPPPPDEDEPGENTRELNQESDSAQMPAPSTTTRPWIKNS